MFALLIFKILKHIKNLKKFSIGSMESKTQFIILKCYIKNYKQIISITMAAYRKIFSISRLDSRIGLDVVF